MAIGRDFSLADYCGWLMQSIEVYRKMAKKYNSKEADALADALYRDYLKICTQK